MSFSESYKVKTFLIEDPDARLRPSENLMAFLSVSGGNFQTIPKGTEVRITDVKVVEAGSNSSIIFGRAISTDESQVFGWTSTRNLAGKFMNETIGVVQPAPGMGRFGPNAAWSNGEYLGQLELVAVVDSRLDIEYLALNTIGAYAALVNAAAIDGIQVTLNSGFRSYPEQKYLHEGFLRKLPGFNSAAKPGYSKHQNGLAFDLAVAGGDGNPTYEWLKRHATKYGFVRTVNKEPWHWESDELKAKLALAGNTFKTPNVIA